MQLDFKEKVDRENAVVLIQALNFRFKLFTPQQLGSDTNIMRRCIYRGWLSRSLYAGQHKYSLTPQGRTMATLLQKITANNAANEKTQTNKGEVKENAY